ncbi:MAG: serine protease, partial [Treponema sp.]|nr:serine protease [Treponema sp.]
SKNTETPNLLIFQQYNVEDEEIIGKWINTDDTGDVNILRLKKYDPLAIIESQEDIKSIPVPIDELREYVGFINQGYHPEMIKFMETWKQILKIFLLFSDDLDADDIDSDKLEKALDNYLKGGFGTGFIYVDNDGKNYIITNYHVINQSQTPSITFENQDGTKTIFKNLKIVMIDEEQDLALLSFSENQEPFKYGIKIQNDTLSDGDEIYAVGYPGFGNQPLWQFGKGIVSNALVYLPKKEDWEDLRGPFVQHTAEVDPGNSGGPLLINIDQSRNYVVTGVNTLKATGRQAANYAIPAKQLSGFIERALLQTNDNEQEIFEIKLNTFINRLKKPDNNIEHISNYISDRMINFHLELVNTDQESILRGTDTIITDREKKLLENIIMKLIIDPIQGIKMLVAYSFHREMGLNLKDNDVFVKDIKSDKKNGFSVSLFINGDIIGTEWIKEYGIWRINNFTVIEHNNNTIKKADKIIIGNTITVNSNTNSKWYKLDMTSGAWLNIFTEGNNDTELFVYDGKGILIAKDDDSGNGYNACIVLGVVKGTVFIEVREHSSKNNNFSLVTKIINRNLQNESRDQAVYIAPGISVTSTFQSSSYVKWYKVEIPSTTNSLTVYSEGHMDTKISLYNNSGKLIEEDDDSGNGYNAKVISSIKGTIYIKIEGLDRRTGEFKLITQVK